MSDQEIKEILEAAETPMETRETDETVQNPSLREDNPEENAGEKIISSLLSEDEENTAELKHLKDVLQALSINGMWFRRHLGLLVLLVTGLILYITNRYMAQKEMIEESRLRLELDDWRYRCMTRQSELTLRCRQSQLEQQLKALGDSTLTVRPVPPFVVTAP